MNINRQVNLRYSSSKRKIPIWQSIILILVLSLLSINALPNLFVEQPAIITSKSELLIRLQSSENPELESVVINAVTIKKWLSSKGITADCIKIEADTISISTSDENELAKMTRVLKEALGNDFPFKVSTLDIRPDWLKRYAAEPIKLGLDLSGGVLFVLKVDLDLALEKRMNLVRSSILSSLIKDKEKPARVSVVKVAHQTPIVKVKPSASLNVERLIKTVHQDYPNLSVDHNNNGGLTFYYREPDLRVFNNETMLQSITTLRSRIEQLGITEAATQRQGSQKIRVELPGVTDPEKAKRIIGATASLEFYQVREKGGKSFKLNSSHSVKVNSIPIFTGDNIKNARAGFDEMGIPLVNLTLDNVGGDKMLNYSSQNIGQQMLTVLTNHTVDKNRVSQPNTKVISNATIQAQLGSRFSITNLSSRHQAQELAMLLRAGSLNAPVTIEKQQTIGASLGESNIDNGFIALILGVAITLAFMIVWYRKLGVIANIALLFNLTSLIGLMSLLPGVVLTLPGIAGLVLTVGMAVDTNVIIFERIKEERNRGFNMQQAIEQGYKNATVSILDANLTTLITAVVLYSIGYGAVKGFAITLGLGIATSLFTGIFFSSVLTKTFYLKRESKRELRIGSNKGKKKQQLKGCEQ